MAATVFLTRKLGGLFPDNAASEELLNSLPMGKTVKAEITQPRNLGHHKKWFALLNAIYPHQSTYPTRESLLAAVKVALGHGETVNLPDGRVVLVPGSISFAKMDQLAFQEFYDKAVELVLNKILPGVDRADLEAQIHDILDGR